MQIFVPPIFHAQYGVTRPQQKIIKAIGKFFVGLGSKSKLSDQEPAVLAVSLHAGKARSQSFSFGPAVVDVDNLHVITRDDELSVAFREPFVLPIDAKGKPKPAELRMTLVFRSWRPLSLTILDRAGAEVARGVIHHEALGKVIESSAPRKDADDRDCTELVVSLAAGEFLGPLDAVSWKGSPYLLRLGIEGDETAPAAWTCFSVLHPWDAAMYGYIQTQRFAMLHTDMRSISALGCVAVTPRADVPPTEEGEPWAGDPTVGIMSKVARDALVTPAMPRHNDNVDTGFFQRGEAFYASTSWASVLVCQRVKGRYVAQALYACGKDRGAFIVHEDWTGNKVERLTPTRFTAYDTILEKDTSASKSGWNVFDLRPRHIVLEAAITVGISACAGGVTCSAEEDPEWLIVWHIDATPSVPLPYAIQELIPDYENLPGLRSICFLHANPWELNKYRKENLYPAKILDKCETFSLMRGPHLSQELAVYSCGQDYFGVRFAASGPQMVGSLDQYKLVDSLGPMSQTACAQESPPIAAGLKSCTAHAYLQDELYGAFRYSPAVEEVIERFGHPSGALRALLQERKRASLLYTIGPVGLATFDTLAKVDAGPPFWVGTVGERWLNPTATSALGPLWEPVQKGDLTCDNIAYIEAAADQVDFSALLKMFAQKNDAVLESLGDDFDLEPVVGDGNCLFRAIAQVIETDESQHQTYRTMAVSHMRAHPAVFNDDTLGEDAEAYFDRMATPAAHAGDVSHYGGGPELIALSRALRRSLFVHAPHFDGQVHHVHDVGLFAPLAANPPVHVYFTGGNHYEALREK